MKTVILNLEECNLQTLSEVGVKSAKLGELKRVGVRTPNGFVISVEAFEQFLSFDKKKILNIKNMFAQINVEDQNSTDDFSKNIKQRIDEISFQPELSSSIISFYKKLSNDCVAVRSSAVIEDLASASFAGQFDSYLGISGEENLLKAIKSCWASFFNLQAILYRVEMNISQEQIEMGVLIQEMVNSEVSGILCTIEPVSMDDGKMVVNSTWGLGSIIVEGLETPDYFLVNKNSNNIIKQEIAGKKIKKIIEDGKLIQEKVSEEKGSIPSLTEKEIVELVEIGKFVEDHFGRAQYIEWSINEEGKLFILQSRPVPSPSKTKEFPFEDNKSSVELLLRYGLRTKGEE